MISPLAALVFLLASGVLQAGVPAVQDSFEEDHPFGLGLTVRYETTSHQADILREYVHKESKSILLLDQLRAKGTTEKLHFDFQMGLYKDLELVAKVPMVLSDRLDLDYHPDVKAAAKAAGTTPQEAVLGIREIDPSTGPYDPTGDPASVNTLIDLPFKGRNRSGLGDPLFGLRWAPWNQDRDEGLPTWILGIMLKVPLAAVKTANNNAVGDGMYRLQVNTTMARRVLPFLQPYFDFGADVALFANSASLYQNYNSKTQNLVGPPTVIGVKLGTEIFPWQAKGRQQFVSIDLGAGFDYVMKGRGYSDLFEALGSSPCRTSDGCGLTTFERDLRGLEDLKVKYQAEYKAKALTKEQYDASMAAVDKELADGKAKDSFRRTDGLTDIDAHGIIRTWFGVGYQPVRYLRVGLDLALSFEQPHLITNADPGSDAVEDRRVDNLKEVDIAVTGYNSFGDNEYNPVYLKEIDDPGKRFKVDGVFNWTLLLSATGQF
jgi:hypothetical protein